MKFQNDFYYAVAYYENGELAAAKELFHNIVIGAPKMHYASIAQKYIEAIESQTEIVLPEQSVLPDENDAVFHDAASSRIDTTEIHVENVYYITEFEFDKDTYWIRVDYLETTPKN